MHGAVVAASDVVFACPDQLHGDCPQPFRNLSALALDARISGSPPAEASAGHLSVKGDCLRLQTEPFGDSRLVSRLELRTVPYFYSLTVKPHGRVQRLHRRVSQIGEFVLSDDPV